MSTEDFGTIEAKATLKQVIDALSHVQDTLNFVVNGNLDANNIRANSIQTKNLKAGSVTADKITVQQLSAIAADLGHITAGLIEAVRIVGSTIIGSYIATADGTYPRIELSSISNLLKAFSDANHYIAMVPEQNGAPTFVIKDPLSQTDIYVANNTGTLVINNGTHVQVGTSAGNLRLMNGPSNHTIVTNWNQLKQQDNGHTLQQDLNAKQNLISGDSGIFYVASTSGGAANVALQFSNGLLISHA